MAITKKMAKKIPPKTVQNFPIIGIGASAGGLDAFKSLLKAIPENSGMAYVLVQHLDPSHESILPEILQRVTKIPVLEIIDDIPLAPNHIYVIPSNKMLISTDGILKLTNREKKINLSIDVFFTSLAEVHKECAVGIVLSGTGSDGTLGLKAIKEHGGISIVQDVESAAFDGMPQSAINAGNVDFILAPENIPEQLLHINSTYRSIHLFKEEEEELPKDDEAIFKKIISTLRQRSGVDFTYYKLPTFHRRIARRIAITKKLNLTDYFKFLRTDKAEQDALFQDVLIPVTSFFRDPKTFQFLSKNVFPALLNNKSQDNLIRIWIAGCSTGEEAYSIAISLHEYLTLTKSESMKIQIFASDISERAIKIARIGMYAKAEVETLSQEQIKNYFSRKNDGYEINKLIRDMCVFAPHNFLKDPPFAKMDIISCRNVLIYMDSFLQKKALTTFHYALKENGFLMLGKSESTSNVSDLFAAADKHEKIYTRKSLPGRFMQVATERKEEALAKKSQIIAKQEATQTDFRKSAEAMLLSKFTPASVIVNEQMDVVHIHGIISPFLEPPQGKPTFNLMKMANEGLAFELRSAIHKAKLREEAAIKENIPVKINGKQFLVSIEIVPLNDTVDIHYLILFTKTDVPAIEDKSKTSGSRKIADTLKQNEQLEKELAHTREDMRSVTEDMEATNEELQSANEELQSSNEEMQSLNEEMETSKEELQSTNEELTIVNQELMDKQEQLNTLHLEQVKANKQIEASEKEQKKLAVHLQLATDSANIGIWSLDIISSKLEWSNIHKKMWGYDEHRENLTYHDWHKVIVQEDKELAFQRIEEAKVNHSIYDTDYRITRPNDGAIVWIKSTGQYYYDELGVAHTLTGISMDITEQKVIDEKLKTIAIELDVKNKLIEASEKRLSNILEQSPDPILILKGKNMILDTANEALYNLWRVDKSAIGIPFLEILPEMKGQGFFELLQDVYLNDKIIKGYDAPAEFIRNNKEKEILYFNYNYQPYREADGSISGVLIMASNVTKSVLAKKLIEESEAKFRTLSETIPHMIWSAGPDGEKNFFNKYYLDYTGLTFEELKAGGVKNIIFHEDLDKDLKLWKHSLKTGEDFNVEKRLRHHNGTYRWHLSHAIAQKDMLGNITGWIGSSTEIEDQKSFTNELIEAKIKAEMATEVAEHSTKAKQQFLSNMSHEIRTPMNAIIGFTKVLQKTDLTEKQKEYLGAIKSSGDTLIVLINDILDIAKVDAGKMIFTNLPFKIAHSISSILHLFETNIQEKNLELVKEYDSRIPEILSGDSVRLHQILINLLSNAIKFTKNGKIIVSVNLLKEDNEKVTLEIKVADTGIGISKNKIVDIFENFEQATNITSSLYGGTGLGLAIVKQLVEKQGGTISVESKEGVGSTFSFILNFLKSNATVVEENEEGHYNTLITPIKVLIVEDVKLNQLLLRTILDDFKFEWKIAENGKIAIEKLQSSTYDIILMDLQMPIMNGFEATEYIRNKMKLQTPIIALTADVTTTDLEKCKAAGMNGYISKPIDEKVLYNKILDLIKH